MSENEEEDAIDADLEGHLLLYLPKDHKVAKIKVEMTSNQPVEKGEDGVIALLTYAIMAVPTPEFQEWADEQGIPFTMEMRNKGILVRVEKEEHLLWIKLRWT